MTARRGIVSPVASDDIAAILDYVVARFDIDSARAVDARIHGAMESFDRFSDRGRVVPELRVRGITIYRELVAMPYRIVYRVTSREVWVVAVFDHRRDLDALLHERARRDAVGRR